MLDALAEPTNGDANESIRYTIGFSLSDGNLDKLASTEVAEKKADCIKWAGKCVFSKAAKTLAEHKQRVKDAEDACGQQLTDWREKNKMNPTKYKKWDSSKGPDTCPKSPPKDADDTYNPETSTCTTTGCNPGVPVWGLWDKDKGTGTEYSSKNDYEEARKLLIGEKCDKQIKDEYENASPPFTNPSSAGVLLSECQNERYWFVDGENKGSEDEWKKGMCAKNKEALLSTTHSGPVEYCDISPIYICGGEEILGDRVIAKAKFETCLANDKNAICTTALNNDALKKSNGGPYTSPTPSDMTAPVGDDCNAQYWYCKGKIHREPDQRKNMTMTKRARQQRASQKTKRAIKQNIGPIKHANHTCNALKTKARYSHASKYPRNKKTY